MADFAEIIKQCKNNEPTEANPLHKICKNTGFHWPILYRVRTIRENTGQWKPVFLHILYRDQMVTKHIYANKKTESCLRFYFSIELIIKIFQYLQHLRMKEVINFNKQNWKRHLKKGGVMTTCWSRSKSALKIQSLRWVVISYSQSQNPSKAIKTTDSSK